MGRKCFEETEPFFFFFVRNRKFGLNNTFWVTVQHKEIDEFCFKIQDGISEIIVTKNVMNTQNLSKLEFTAHLINNEQSRFHY